VLVFGAWQLGCAAGAPQHLLLELADLIACVTAIYDKSLRLNSTTVA
jgi:hypothetical protein